MRERTVVSARSCLVLALFAVPILLFGQDGNGGNDLAVYRLAGWSIAHHQPLYGFAFGTQLRDPLPFTYPPFAALLGMVPATVPLVIGNWLLSVATVVALGVCVRSCFPAIAESVLSADLAWALITGAMLYTYPFRDHLVHGQIDVFLMTLCLVDCTRTSGRRPQGLLIGLCTAVKIVPGVFIVFLWLAGRKSAALLALGTFSICTVIGAVAAPGDTVNYWGHAVWRPDRIGDNSLYTNQSLRGLVLRTLPPELQTQVLVVAGLAVVALGWVAVRRALAAGEDTAAAVVADLTGLLVSPVSWIHGFVWLVPALGVLLGFARHWLGTVTAAATAVGLFAALPALPRLAPAPAPLTLLFEASYGLLAIAAIGATAVLAKARVVERVR